MIKILNQQRQPIAILENAYGISYEKRLNEIWSASFSLPLDDSKNAECQSLNYVELVDDLTGEYIGLFRIVPSHTRKLATANEISYECEHVLATLLGDVLFEYHQTINWTTRQNIEYLLGKQTTAHWQLGSCEFTRYFHYKWEDENGLLGPLLSIVQPFDEQYVWTYDTSVYPWTINLVHPSTVIECEIRYGKNQSEIERDINPEGIVNRIYPKGYGEGVNQLTIRAINANVPYLENAASIAQYGLNSYVWVDRRLEDADLLKSSAQALLNEWSIPKVSYRVKAVDLSIITGVDADKLRVGRIVRIVDPDLGTFEARIVSEAKSDMVGDPGNIELEIANKTDDIGTTSADIERRQQINEVYAQGATNLDSHGFSDNCDSTHPAAIRFYLPEDLVNVNVLNLTFETVKFRAYSKAANSTSTTTKTTSSGGSSTQTSTSGGGSTVTSSSGGGTTATSSSGGGTTATSTHKTFQNVLVASGVPENSVGTENWGYHIHHVNIDGSYFSHDHNVTIPSHTHSVTVPNHSHSVIVPSHSHDVTIPAHSHSVDIPGHGHSLDYGIYEESTLPTSVSIKVDGISVPGTAISAENLDLIPYLAKEADGKVKRGAWHTVELAPNGLAKINAQIVSRLFIQSRIGGNY